MIQKAMLVSQTKFIYKLCTENILKKDFEGNYFLWEIKFLQERSTIEKKQMPISIKLEVFLIEDRSMTKSYLEWGNKQC